MSAPVRLPLNDALAPERPMLRRLAAVAFLDVVGYSRLMGGDEDATLREWASLQRMVIEPRVVTWRGRIANKAGDGIFLEFRSALDAFRWAVDVQKAIGARHAAIKLQVRVALHLGDVIDDADGEVQGDGVNTAARLQSFAKPGGIVVSQAIANEVLGKTEVAFEDLGPLQLKNMARPVHAFHVVAGRPGLTLGSLVSIAPGADIVRAFPAAVARAAPARMGRAALVKGALGVLAVVLLLAAVALGPWGPMAVNVVAAHRSARETAIRLYEDGRAVGCAQHPCPREWLAARALYERAIAADPTYAPPYARAAFTYTNFIENDLSLNEKEDLRAAERLATQGAALAPGDALSHEARGAVLEQDPGRLEDALAAYMRSLAIEPDQPALRATVGWVLILLGRAGEAERYLNAALAAAPDHPRASSWLTFLGLAELFQDRPGHGADLFRRALAQESTDAANGDISLQRRLYLAAALALNGAVEDARQVIDAVRQLHPAVSTRTVWDCTCSNEAGFLTGFAILRRGVVLAGVPETL